jgi:hypothetical protein
VQVSRWVQAHSPSIASLLLFFTHTTLPNTSWSPNPNIFTSPKFLLALASTCTHHPKLHYAYPIQERLPQSLIYVQSCQFPASYPFSTPYFITSLSSVPDSVSFYRFCFQTPKSSPNTPSLLRSQDCKSFLEVEYIQKLHLDSPTPSRSPQIGSISLHITDPDPSLPEDTIS